MREAQTVRLLLADDHLIVRKGLRAVLGAEPDLEVVVEAANGNEAVELYQLHRPDVALLDLRMPGLDGVEALTAIRAGDPAARVILLTTFDDEEDVHRGLRAGARGYLLKDATPQDLAGAIRKVVAGQLAIAAGVAARLAERLQGSALSEREMEVLRLVALGRSNKQIAKALDIAEGTVKVHVASILEKLGAHGRTEAVAFAARRGLIRLA